MHRNASMRIASLPQACRKLREEDGAGDTQYAQLGTGMELYGEEEGTRVEVEEVSGMEGS